MNRRTVDTGLSSAPTHLIKREPGNEARLHWESLAFLIELHAANVINLLSILVSPKLKPYENTSQR